jgi:four helix bundle protein
LADELALAVYRQTGAFPGDEQFGLTSQMRRAAVSLASNIVEGCSRESLPDYVRFLDMAHGSAHEVEYQISLAHRLGYLDDEQAKTLTDLAIEACKVLNGLIRALRAT